jgi:hypothetical protein
LNMELEIILICEIDSMSKMKQECGIDEPLWHCLWYWRRENTVYTTSKQTECWDTCVTNLIDFACFKYNNKISGTLLSCRRLAFLLHKYIAFTRAVFILP